MWNGGVQCWPLTTSPHGAYRDADRHFRLADGIIQRVFQGYRGKVQVRQYSFNRNFLSISFWLMLTVSFFACAANCERFHGMYPTSPLLVRYCRSLILRFYKLSSN